MFIVLNTLFCKWFEIMKNFPSTVVLYFCCYVSLSTGKSSQNESYYSDNYRSKRAVTDYLILTEVQKKLIVDKHNELRRIVRPSASDMLYMTWHNGLEKLATDYSRKCVFGHNPNRKINGFKYVGENIYISSGVAVTDKFGADAVVSWDDEKKDYNYSTSKCTQGKVCGHYTQTAWAKSYKVGCGVSMCDRVVVSQKIWTDVALFVCNYAPGGNSGGAIYTQGPFCTMCPEGDVCVDKLCTNSTRDTSGATKTTKATGIWKYFLLLSCIIFLQRNSF